MFKKIYEKILIWASHKYSIRYLFMISLTESFILPYPPPDILLAPMTLKNPKKGYWFAWICTLSSVIGGVVGYTIGYYGIDLITPFLEKINYIDKLDMAKTWFDEYGILIVFIAGFSPIPYKIFTLGAGIMSMALIPFIIVSIIARGLRYFLVVFLVKKFGDECDKFLKKYVDYLGYGVIIIILLYILFKSL